MCRTEHSGLDEFRRKLLDTDLKEYQKLPCVSREHLLQLPLRVKPTSARQIERANGQKETMLHMCPLLRTAARGRGHWQTPRTPSLAHVSATQSAGWKSQAFSRHVRLRTDEYLQTFSGPVRDHAYKLLQYGCSNLYL